MGKLFFSIFSFFFFLFFFFFFSLPFCRGTEKKKKRGEGLVKKEKVDIKLPPIFLLGTTL